MWIRWGIDTYFIDFDHLIYHCIIYCAIFYMSVMDKCSAAATEVYILITSCKVVAVSNHMVSSYFPAAMCTEISIVIIHCWTTKVSTFGSIKCFLLYFVTCMISFFLYIIAFGDIALYYQLLKRKEDTRLGYGPDDSEEIKVF